MASDPAEDSPSAEPEGEAAADSKPAEAAAPSQPLREDQVLNAVGFLLHEKVHSASDDSKRAFLLKKGLTTEEIDEAFKRAKLKKPFAPSAPAPATASAAPVRTKPFHGAAGPASRLATVAGALSPQGQAQGQGASSGVVVSGPMASQALGRQAAVPSAQAAAARASSENSFSCPFAGPPSQSPPTRRYSWLQLALSMAVVSGGAYTLRSAWAPRVSAAYRSLQDRLGLAWPGGARAQEELRVQLAAELGSALASQLKSEVGGIRAVVEDAAGAAREAAAAATEAAAAAAASSAKAAARPGHRSRSLSGSAAGNAMYDMWGVSDDAVRRELEMGEEGVEGAASPRLTASAPGPGISRAELRQELREFIQAFGEMYGTPGTAQPSAPTTPFPAPAPPPPTPASLGPHAPHTTTTPSAGPADPLAAVVRDLRNDLMEIKLALARTGGPLGAVPKAAPSAGESDADATTGLRSSAQDLGWSSAVEGRRPGFLSGVDASPAASASASFSTSLAPPPGVGPTMEVLSPAGSSLGEEDKEVTQGWGPAGRINPANVTAAAAFAAAAGVTAASFRSSSPAVFPRVSLGSAISSPSLGIDSSAAGPGRGSVSLVPGAATDPSLAPIPGKAPGGPSHLAGSVTGLAGTASWTPPAVPAVRQLGADWDRQAAEAEADRDAQEAAGGPGPSSAAHLPSGPASKPSPPSGAATVVVQPRIASAPAAGAAAGASSGPHTSPSSKPLRTSSSSSRSPTTRSLQGGGGAATPPKSPGRQGQLQAEGARGPRSYMEVLEMLERGETPPGINERIRDTPPDPEARPSAPKLKPRPKPWERSADSGASAPLTASQHANHSQSHRPVSASGPTDAAGSSS